jgi:hypothetical protein
MVTNDGRISLIECELVLEKNNETDKNTPFNSKSISGYTPPEVLGINISTNIHNESRERFPLSVIIYELIFRIHPYSATFTPPYNHLVTLDEKVENNLFVHGGGSKHISLMPPEHQGFDNINHKLKSLFYLAFDTNSKDRRPTPQLWENTLTLLVSEKNHGLQPTSNLKTITSQPNIQHQNRESDTNHTPVYMNTNNIPNDLNTDVKASGWVKNKFELAIIIFIFIVLIITLVNAGFDSNTENAAEDLYDAQLEVSDAEQELNEWENKTLTTSNEAKVVTLPKLTNQFLYVLSDKANLRQRPSLTSPVVMKLEYNTELTQTDSPLIEDGGITWINVASNGGTRGRMSSIILSKYPRNILHSRCGFRSNEVEYIVASAGVNIRNAANTNDNSVIGVMQKDEIVCPYMYIGTYDESIGRWMGFQLTSGEVAWVAESLLEPYYEPEPESEPYYDPSHEPNTSSPDTNTSDYDEYNSWF